jgi:hypothetical protein
VNLCAPEGLTGMLKIAKEDHYLQFNDILIFRIKIIKNFNMLINVRKNKRGNQELTLETETRATLGTGHRTKTNKAKNTT